MAFDRILSGDMLGYLQQNAVRRGKDQPLVFFIHIPKTAGSSFREEIADVLQPDINVEVDYDAINPRDIDLDFNAQLQKSLQNFAQLSANHRIAFASGHIRYRQLTGVDVAPDVLPVTMLRDPISRLVSDFRFRTSKNHPQNDHARAMYPSFRHFVEHESNQNVLFDYLCATPEDSLQQVVDSLMKNFLFVGVQESYDICLKLQMALIGARARPRYVLRQAEKLSVDDLEITKEDFQRARELNEMDRALYEVFASFWRTHSKSFHYFFDHDRIFKMLAGLPYKK